MGIGSGIGHFALWGDGPYGPASISGLGMRSSIAIGGSPAPGLAIVGVVEGVTRSDSTFNGGTKVSATTTMVQNGQTVTSTGPLTGHSSASMFLFGAGVDWYPAPDGGWHVGAAAGLGGVGVVDDGGNSMAGLSAGASLFGGHQWWLGKAWSLGISGFVTGTSSVKFNDSNQNDLGYRMMPLSAGIESLLLYY